MVRLHPVSGSVRHVRPSSETDKLNKVEQVVCVPVCILFLQIIFVRVV
jgi:hypothetical protein